MLRTDDFHYDLPDGLIARHPVEPRDSCRLMMVERSTETFRHLQFSDLPGLLRPGDRLVFNDTRVLPARLFTRKPNGVRIELFFLEEAENGNWRALVRPGKRAPAGVVLAVEDHEEIRLRIAAGTTAGERTVQIDSSAHMTIPQLMETCGHIPLPHYIRRDDVSADRENYQTVYAAVPGAVASPTAGLHFTPSLMEQLRRQGVGLSCITLHVGIGTFRPVKVEFPADHPMHEERYAITAAAAGEIRATKEQGGRIIAVGTTVVRVLEHCAAQYGTVTPHEGVTRIKILPPYRFGMVDGMITNFHLPESTLLMLVSAFADREKVLRAYKEAIEMSYRFYSYGDAMFLV